MHHMTVARPVEAVTRGDVDVIRYDDLSYEGTKGRVGVTLFIPSARHVAIHGAPDVVAPYSAGWGEGLGAARQAGEALARAAGVMTVVIDYPRRRLEVHDIVPFRTAVLAETIGRLAYHGTTEGAKVVVTGYSRGSQPARLAALDQSARVTGLCLVAPTWFRETVKPHELATRGLAESARGLFRGGWLDRIGLVAASMRLAQEMVTHPLELRRDVAAISEEGRTDLQVVLDAGLRVGVVGGRHDELCELGGIHEVIDALADPGAVTFREVDSDHFSYFLNPGPLRVVAALVQELGGMTATGVA